MSYTCTTRQGDDVAKVGFLRSTHKTVRIAVCSIVCVARVVLQTIHVSGVMTVVVFLGVFSIHASYRFASIHAW